MPVNLTPTYQFSGPPGWPIQPYAWEPPAGWEPDPTWPAAPAGWEFWSRTTRADTHLLDHPMKKDAQQRLQTVEAECSDQRQKVDALTRELVALRARSTQPGTTPNSPSSQQDDSEQVLELNDALTLQQVGIYQYHHPLENAEMYKERLADLRGRIKDQVKAGEAILVSPMFAYNNSLAKGRRMTSDLSKLMLRAYNAEADNCVRSLRAGAVVTATSRLETAVSTIARLGAMMEMRVSPAYHSLRVEEIELTGDYLFKVQEERETARDERERLRDERKAAQELAAERARLDKERSHYANTLATLTAQGKMGEVADIEQRLIEIDAAIATNDYRTANIRAGYVYVISNIGTYGPGVVKIGLTRRLEPLDRIRELGGASVPFPFDVHALYFSDDAVTLENELHGAFASRRLNQVNLRREFFFATPDEVRAVLVNKLGNLLEFTEAPEATQYFQSRAAWPTTTPATS
jgi:hypothetical protein